MSPDQQDQRGLFGADNTAEATHQLHEGTRAMATRYDTSIPSESKQSNKQDLARELLPLLVRFRTLHRGEFGYGEGEAVDFALRVLTINAQYDAQDGGA